MAANVPDVDREDVRFAVVMNGGVSLAIWIGGVAYELNRVTQRNPPPETGYDALLNIVRGTARVDVISGTSAGGLNGAFLALATAYDTTLAPLGNLWAEAGGLTDLLRRPLDSNPPSLLKGDEYFLPQLRSAFENILPAGGRGYVAPADVPLDLTITTSLMEGRLAKSVDDFGTDVVEMEHRARFHFVRSASAPEDPFLDAGIVGQLALAARSTASFPFAFEPSFVPVANAGVPEHPDMGGYVDFPGSRFVLDGGVLLNKPVGPALEAIFRQPADRQVRRLLLYVNPDPGSPEEPRPDQPDQPYGLARVMTDSLVSLPRAQSITQDLADLREHNRRVRDAQQMRPDLLAQLGNEVVPLAARMFQSYRRVRTRLALNRILDAYQPPSDASTPTWTRDDLVEAFEAGDDAQPPPALPFVPASAGRPPDGTWDWGLEPVERLGWVTLDLLRGAIIAAPVVGDLADQSLRGALRNARFGLHALLLELRGFRDAEEEYWQLVARALPDPPAVAADRRETLRQWAVSAVQAWPAPSGSPRSTGAPFTPAGVRDLADRILDVLLESEPLVRQAAALGGASREPVIRKQAAELHAVLETLLAEPPSPAPPRRGEGEGERSQVAPTTREAVVSRLLAVEVAYVTLTGGFHLGGQDVLFMQVDGRTPHGLGGSTPLGQKLAGVQLGHFGAFYKRSWRVNDWIWGRLDGATRLVEGILGATRLRQLRYSVDEAMRLLREVAVGPADDPFLAQRWDADRQAIRAELSFLDDPELPVPPSVPLTAKAVTRRIHVDILREGLGPLSDAVEFDVDRGASRTGNGPNFAAAYRQARARHPAGIPTDRLFSLFEQARVGEERIAGEAGTDLLAETASTAAAVGVATLDLPGVKLGPARAVLRSLRAVTLTLYALVYGSVEGSRFGAAAVNFALCAGGALLAISLLSDAAPPLLTGIAAVLVVAALALAALRSRLWLMALALGVPLVVAITVVVAGGAGEALRDNAAVIVTVVGLIAGTALLGSVRTPSRPLVRFGGWRTAAAVVVFVGSLVVVGGIGMLMQDQSPGRVIRFGFSGTVTRAVEVLDDWGDAGRLDDAAETLLIDYAFLAVYWIPVAIATSAVAAGCRRTGLGRWWTVGAVLSWLAPAAALLDAAENALLLAQVDHARDGEALGQIDPMLPAVAATVAGLKFVFLAAAALYVVVIGARVRLRRGGSAGIQAVGNQA